MAPFGTWGQSARGGGGFGNYAGGFSTGPAGTYDPPSTYMRGAGSPSYLGPGDSAVEKRRFAEVGKMNLNLLDPLAAERAREDLVPLDDAPEGPLGGLEAYYSPSTPGGFFAGALGAIGSTVGGFLGEEGAKVGSTIGATIGKTAEIPMTVVGGLGLESVPFVAPIIDNANSIVEENTPYILRDTLKIPKNFGGAFQSMLNVLGLAGRAVERTYAGMTNRISELPPDIQARVDSGELSSDEALDELVMSGRGFTNDPWHNMVFSMLTDPTNWASLGVGAVAGAARGTSGVARVFGSAAGREGGVVARLAAEGTDEIGDLARAALAGEDLAARNLTRSQLTGMRKAINQDLAERVANGEDIPSTLKLKMTERMGMSALGPISEEATRNTVFRAANAIARATDPINWFSGSKAGQRSMDQLHMAAATGVRAALPELESVARLADDITAGGGDRIMAATGTWGANAMQEVAGDDVAKGMMQSGGVPRVGSLSSTEATRQTIAGGGYDANLGKYIEIHVEKTKDIRVASLPPKQMYDETVAKLARILDVDPTQVTARLKSVSPETAMTVHGLYYYTKGATLHTDVVQSLAEAAAKGTLPKDINPDDLTMITPRRLTNKRAEALEKLLKKKGVTAEEVRTLIEGYDDFNWSNRQVTPDAELIGDVTAWLDTNRAYLPKEIELLDAAGHIRPDIELNAPELAKWAEDSGDFGYGLANGMPKDAPIDAQYRVTYKPNGTMLNARPWLDFWAEGVPSAKRLSRFQGARMAMTRSVRGERILWQQRRRFVTDMASTETTNGIAVPPALADRIFKALMYEAQQGRVLPRGMSPDQMMGAVAGVLADVRNHSGQWRHVAGQLTERQITLAFLRAMEGDVRTVGLTQKVTGRVKSRAPGAGANFWGQMSEKLYPLMRFTLNPIFMAMEATEPYVMSYARGIRLPLRRDSKDFKQGLASHNATRQLIFASDEPDGLLAQSMEMNALQVYGAREAQRSFGPRTLLGKLKGSRPAIAERKQAAAGLQTRRLIGDNLYRAFREIKGDDFNRFWGDLEYRYGVIDRAEVADRWLAENLSLQDKDGFRVGLSYDMVNAKNLGQRLRFSTDGARKGDYTYGDVEELLDLVRQERGEETRIGRGGKAGDALLEDLRSMTLADWEDEVARAGHSRQVGRISDSQSADIWQMAHGPKVEPFWKGYRDTYMRGIKGTTAVATRRARDLHIKASRALVRAMAMGKHLSEEEFIALHFADIPRWLADPGTLPPEVLTDFRSDFGRAVLRRGNPSAPANVSRVRWAVEAGHDLSGDPQLQVVVNRLREGSEDRGYLYIPIHETTLARAVDAKKVGYGDPPLAAAYRPAATEPVRAISKGTNTSAVIRIKRDSAYASQVNPTTSPKRLKSHDYTLDDDLYAAKGVEVFTNGGWVDWEDYVKTEGTLAPKLHRTTTEPWWDQLMDPAFGEGAPTYPWKVDLDDALTPGERSATQDYTGIIYKAINGYLRGDDFEDFGLSNERIEQLIDHLDASIQKGSFRERKTLWRGINISEALDNGLDIEPLYDKQVGELLDPDPAFLSTSADAATAGGFAGDHGAYPGQRSILIKYDMPPGWPMNLVEGGEGEYLMGRDIPLRVVERTRTVRDSAGGYRLELTVVPDGEPNLRGVNLDMLGQPVGVRRNEELARHLAVSDPQQLRSLLDNVTQNREGYEELIEEAIRKAEAAKPAERDLNINGRRFGRLTPQDTLDDIIDGVGEDGIPSYATTFSDLRERVTDLMTTEADDTAPWGEMSVVWNNHDMRMLAALGAAAAEQGGQSVPAFLAVLEYLWHEGPPSLDDIKDLSPANQTALFMAQDMLRGLRDPMTTPALPARTDDAIDVLLGNKTRRAIGRTDAGSMPIIADDAAYEGAGFLTRDTYADITPVGRGLEPPTQAPIGEGPVTRVQSLGGSTGAELVEDATGRRYVEKRGASPGHIREESIADDVYTAMGVPVPAQRLLGDTKRANYIEGGVTLDKWVETATEAEQLAMRDQIGEWFALDALLANWDSIGLVGDNIVIKDGIAYRIDNGGSLRYRAMGASKGGAFGETVGELRTLRDPSMNEWGARVYGGLYEGDIRRQVLALDAKRETILAALPPELRDTVSARLDNMLDQTKNVEPTPFRPSTEGPMVDAITDDTHHYLVNHYNEVARLANERGLGGYKEWTAADMAHMAGRARETRGRKPGSLTQASLDRQVQQIPGEVYFPPGSDNEWMNPLLDLLNRPDNRAARDLFMQQVTVPFLQRLRDQLGLVVDQTDTRGIGIWDGGAPQSLVPLHILSTPARGDELADVLSYAMQQAEVWHYNMRGTAQELLDAGEDLKALDPRVTIAFAGKNAKADAEAVATAIGQQLPFARGATALQLPNGTWQVSVVDRSGTLKRLPDGRVDTDVLAAQIDEVEQGLGEEALASDHWVQYGTTYVAGPDRLPDGTLDWGGHRAKTEEHLSSRGTSSSIDALDGLRASYDELAQEGLSNAAPQNFGRAQRREPISAVLEDRRGGQVFGTTTPAAVNAAVIRGFGAADPLTGIHELVHVFSIGGLDPSLREAVSREWDKRVVHIEQRIAALEKRATSHSNPSVRTRARNEMNALRNDLQNPTPGQWSKAQEEFFAHMVLHWINTGDVANPDLANALNHFRNWVGTIQKERATNGLPPIEASPQMQAKFNRMTSRPGVETVPYSVEDQVLRQAARGVVREAWDEAHSTQFYKKDRSALERSINHPYIGLYPASYMWGKVLPEMVRFLALRPFGMTTPFLGWNIAREVGDSIRSQSENDPSVKQFLADNEDAFMFLSMFFPGLPQDIPANFSLPLRRIAEQGLEGQQAVAMGQAPGEVEYLRGAQDAIQYAVGPLGTVRTIGDIAGMAGELISTMAGAEPATDEARALLPLR